MKKNSEKLEKVSHKINNLLANISLSAQVLYDGAYGAVTKQQKKSLTSIVVDSKKIKNLVNKLGKK